MMKTGLRWIQILTLAVAWMPTAGLAVDITTSQLPGGMEMVPYSARLEATNGVDFTWSVPPPVVAWGRKDSGRTNVPEGLSGVIAIAAGGHHNLALRGDGTVVAWGVNYSGQSSVPYGLSDVTTIAAGGEHSLALRGDGSVVAWGDNGYGQASVPEGLTNVTAIAAGSRHSLALRGDGSVVAWGYNGCTPPIVPAGLTNVVAIAAGGSHNLALRGDGTVVAWGDNWNCRDGQTNVPAGLTNVIALAAGDSHSLALRGDGTVVAWGQNNSGQASVPEGLTNVIAIAAGGYHSLALKGDGSVVAWGNNGSGQAIVPGGLSDVVAISAGVYHNLALRPQLPPGLTLSSAGELSGTPVLAGTYRPTFIVQNSSGSQATRKLDIVIEPHPNTRPVVDSTAPPQGLVMMPENSSQLFSVEAHDLEGQPLTYAWTLNGEPVGNGTASYTHTTGDAGLHALRCYVSDDFWSNHVYASWWIDVRAIPIEILTDQLPGGMEMVPYSATLEATNRVGGTVTWSVMVMPPVVAWGRNYEGQASVPDELSGVIALAAGHEHNLALRGDGSVVAWGYNQYGYGHASVPEGLSGVTAIAAGHYHSLALRGDGSVVAWGSDWDGQTSVPEGLTNVIAIAAGYYHSLALRGDGRVVAWGDNEYGQVRVPAGLTNVVAIAAGGYHNLALRGDGRVVAWGNNEYGQTSVPDGLTNVVAIAAGGRHNLALRGDGSVVAWGGNWSGQASVPEGLTNVVAIAAGGRHSLALRGDGSVVAWGEDNYGQTRVPEGLTNVVAIAAGWGYSLALRRSDRQLPPGLTLSPAGELSGTPILAGTYRPTFVVQNSSGSQVTKEVKIVIAPNPNTRPVVDSTAPSQGSVTMPENSSRGFSVEAHDSEGQPLTYAWTLNGEPVGDGTANYTFTADWEDAGFYVLRCYVSDDLWDRVVHAQWNIYVQTVPIEILTSQLSGGMELVPYSATLEATNGLGFAWSLPSPVVAWGGHLTWDENWDGQTCVPEGLSDVTAIAAGYAHNLALRGDGSVVAWGANGYGQARVPKGLRDVTAIAAGRVHSLALRGDGTVVAWGYNGDGQTRVPEGLTNVVAIAGGVHHSLALRGDGSVVTWGANGYGQSSVPAGLTNVVAIAAGGFHNLVLRGDGSVVAWGANGYGQARVPAGLTNVTAIAAGYYHSLALRADGSVVAWGRNNSGQTSVPKGLTNVIAIAAGWEHSLALRGDGTVVAWGANGHGQTNVPKGLGGVAAIAAGYYHSLALYAPLPAGLTLSRTGELSGTPILAGTYRPMFVVQNSSGLQASKEVEIVIAPNPNTRPVVDSTTPPQGLVTMVENSNQLFSVVAHDAEGQPLTYAWTLNGAPVGDGTANYTHTTDWGDAGIHVLRCYVSDDLWTNHVYASWWVHVPAPSPSTLAGRVRGAGAPLEGAYVELRRVDGSVRYRVSTDAAGDYVFNQVPSGYYCMKVGADSFADVWYPNAPCLEEAEQLTVLPGSVMGGLDVDLTAGQSPALVAVTSEPAGAEIYLNYWPTEAVTPAIIPVGEVGDWDWAGYRLASPVITLKKAGCPRPSPQVVPAAEAETVAVSFDLTPGATGAVSVVTTPAGADVYVDYADVAEGVTPLLVGNLAPGWHTILLRKSGCLQPRPIVARVLEHETTEIVIPLEPDTAESRMMAEADSIPQGIPIYVDYLPSGQVTGAILGLMDPTSHVEDWWHSASHTIWLRRPGAPQMAPRYVPEIANTMHQMLIHLSVDPSGLNDCNGDGIPDWWWEQHGFDPCNPPNAKAPADGSGMSYEDKFRAGLIPGNPDSRIGVEGWTVEGTPETGLTITCVFDTVPGRCYLVQARENLTEGGWSNISGVITATAYQTVFSAQAPDGAKHYFYRLIELVP